jgi:hypothetical protein
VPLKSDGVSVEITTTPGSQFVATNIKSPALTGTYPGFQFMVLHTLAGARGIADYLLIAVRRALRRDGVPESQVMPITFEPSDRLRIVLVMSQDEVTTLARSIQAATDVANQLSVVRRS